MLKDNLRRGKVEITEQGYLISHSKLTKVGDYKKRSLKKKNEQLFEDK